jgi:geranylgeranyl pyrophosphate synthase
VDKSASARDRSARSPREHSAAFVASPELLALLESSRAEVDAILPDLLPPPSGPEDRVREAMVYALLAPGKRMRPILTLMVAGLYGKPSAEVLGPAGAIEMVHAASLILDDLPCMDAASLRRGRAATHVVYGEATAILAAVALLNHAYGVVSGMGGGEKMRDRLRASLGRRFSEAIGTHGVIGGQQADLLADGRTLALRELEFIHSHKTGSLFIASAEVGALVASAGAEDLAALQGYAKNLGLAFQITDDILDVQGDAATTGKDSGRDAGRTTFVTLCGAGGARELASELIDAAVGHLDRFGKRARMLKELALFIARRDR